jgi:hypothetical protein
MRDGYKPMMPLEKFLSAKSFLAISDVDAQKDCGQKYKDEMEAAPFYLIYQGLSQRHRFQMALQLNKIHVVPTIGNVSLLYPKDDPAAKTGFDLFNKTASAVMHQSIKGKHGLELNYPKVSPSIGIKNN